MPNPERIFVETDPDFFVLPGIGNTKLYRDAHGTLGRVHRLEYDVFRIEAQLGSSLPNRVGYEDKIRSRPGFDRAHAIGRSLGHESPFGITLASVDINKSLQKRVELYLIDLNNNKGLGVNFYLTVEIKRESHLLPIQGKTTVLGKSNVQNLQFDFLKEVTYTIHTEHGNPTQTRVFEIGFEVSNPTESAKAKLVTRELFESPRLQQYLISPTQRASTLAPQPNSQANPKPKSQLEAKEVKKSIPHTPESNQAKPLRSTVSTSQDIAVPQEQKIPPASSSPTNFSTEQRVKTIVTPQTTKKVQSSVATPSISQESRANQPSQRGIASTSTSKQPHPDIKTKASNLKKMWKPVAKGLKASLILYNLFDTIFTFQELENYIYSTLNPSENPQLKKFKQYINNKFTSNIPDTDDTNLEFFEEREKLIYNKHNDKQWSKDSIDIALSWVKDYPYIFGNLLTEINQKIDLFPIDLIEESKKRGDFLRDLSQEIYSILPYLITSTAMLDGYMIYEQIRRVGIDFNTLSRFLDERNQSLIEYKSLLLNYENRAIAVVQYLYDNY